MSETSKTGRGSYAVKATFSCLGIVLITGAILLLIFATVPEPQRESATLDNAMQVETLQVERSDFRPVLIETGTVKPAQEVMLRPRVSGEVLSMHPNFEPGGFIEAGEVLLQIDPADFENEVMQRRSALLQAESDLALEMGRADVALQDLELLRGRTEVLETPLARREPQIIAARAMVESARAALAQAELDLDRTNLKAPFDAQIVERMADQGSLVNASSAAARIVGVDTYWVVAAIPPIRIPYIEVVAKGEEGEPVTVKKQGDYFERTGVVRRLIGELEEETRLAQLIIEVEDPLSLLPASKGFPPLLIGEFLEVQIPAKLFRDVVRLPLEYVRRNDTAWVMTPDSKLHVAELKIAYQDAYFAYVESGLEHGDQVVTTNITRAIPGTNLRLKEPVEADTDQ